MNVIGWNLSNLGINSPVDANFTLTVTATEENNNNAAQPSTATATETVTISPPATEHSALLGKRDGTDNSRDA